MLPVPDIHALRPLFTPERPGPTMWAHVAATGVGRCRADRVARARAATGSTTRGAARSGRRRASRAGTPTTPPGNGPSRAVAARLGFRHERDDVLYALGVPVPE